MGRIYGCGSVFSIDATVNSETFKHSQFVTLKMKDAIVDYFQEKFKRRPNVETRNPDIKFHLHIDRELVTISLDSSGDPLFKRGYRREQEKLLLMKFWQAECFNWQVGTEKEISLIRCAVPEHF
jgi:23S rRNA G2445 N2-methylase RlmL